MHVQRMLEPFEGNNANIIGEMGTLVQHFLWWKGVLGVEIVVTTLEQLLDGVATIQHQQKDVDSNKPKKLNGLSLEWIDYSCFA